MARKAGHVPALQAGTVLKIDRPVAGGFLGLTAAIGR